MTQRPTRPLANAPRVIVTRHLMPEVEARMRELFDVELNASDVPLTRAQLAEVLALNIEMGGGPGAMYASKALAYFDALND